MRLVFMEVHSRYGCHYLKDILCSTDLWRRQGSEEFTLPHLLQDTGELVQVNRGGVFLATRCPKIDRNPLWGVGSKNSVMTQALRGVALLSCKVWHLVPWLAEQVG